MGQKSIPAVFMRGGTSRALFFHQRDLPAALPPRDCKVWDPIFTAALGSPDPNGRQLDGMGGGISSLSKIAVIGPSTRPDADVDYTFAQVGIADAVVGYRGNCGNISSAVGPFALDEGLVAASGDSATVRIHNTNTGKVIVARFPVENGKAAVQGDFVLQGVAGTGAEIRLAFTDPGGATTGKLLPTGCARDTLEIAAFGALEVSLVDAANPAVFLRAEAIGLSGTETPDALTNDKRAMALFEDIRAAAALKMGLIKTAEEARTKLRNLPLVGLLSSPADTTTASGAKLAADDMDIIVRMISAGQPHKATPLTGAMCLAVAARVPGTLANAAARQRKAESLRVAHPSGILPVAARVREENGGVVAEEAVVYRTARRLMEGRVLIPS
jgi:2-methylaconitate isomerase